MTGTTGTEGRTRAGGETTGADGGECPCQPCRERAQKGRVRAGRWLARNSDLTKPPIPTLRWTLLLILGLCCWAAGIPLDVKDWLGPIIIAGALILPDVAGFGIAGVRLDLREAKREIATLRQDVNSQARSSASAAFYLGNEFVAAIQDRAQEAMKLRSDEASGEALPWQGPPLGVDNSPGEDVTS